MKKYLLAAFVAMVPVTAYAQDSKCVASSELGPHFINLGATKVFSGVNEGKEGSLDIWVFKDGSWVTIVDSGVGVSCTALMGSDAKSMPLPPNA